MGRQGGCLHASQLLVLNGLHAVAADAAGTPVAVPDPPVCILKCRRPQTRVYRVFDLFKILDYSMVLSQGALMLLRNYLYVFFTVRQGRGRTGDMEPT